MMSAEDETRALTEVTQRLAERFPEIAADVVESTVTTVHRRFDGSPIRDFVPLLVERMAKTSLTAGTWPSSAKPADDSGGEVMERVSAGARTPSVRRPAGPVRESSLYPR